jgi:hypothetical protein
MSFTTPITVSAFDKFLASYWNTYVRDNLNFLKTEKPDWVSVNRTTSDFIKNANTTLSDVTGLSFSIAASEAWLWWASVYFLSDVTADLKIGITFPSGAAGRYGGIAEDSRSVVLSASTAFPSNGADELLIVAGLVVNSTTAGTLQIQAAQNASDVSNTTIYTHSSVLAIRV